MYRQSEKKLVKQQYLFHVPSQYGAFWPTNGLDRLEGLWNQSKFQRGSPVGFVTAATSLNGSQPNFARCLAVCWAGIIYIFGGSCPLTEFCHVQNSLCVPALRSPDSVTARQWSRGVRQTLRHGTRNGMELSPLVIFNRGRHLYSEGGHRVGHRPTF